MNVAEKFIIFLCSGAANAGNSKLSFRIASQLEVLGIADIGNLKSLSEQHSASAGDQRRMIFINDCRSSCVNLFTHGFLKEKYLYFDVSPFLTASEFDVENYIKSEIIPAISRTWNYSLSEENHSA